MERLKIEIEGDLPEENKYAILADADADAKVLAGKLSDKYHLTLTAAARPIRVNGPKTSAVAGDVAQASTLAPVPGAVIELKPDAEHTPVVVHRRGAAGD